MATIIFNGKTYNSVEEMPANERQAFQQLSTMFVDKNGNGIPDFLEGDMAKNVMTAFTSNINIDGKNYGSVNELPQDMQTKVQDAFEKMAELGIVTKTSSPMLIQTNSVQAGGEPQTLSTPFVSREFTPAIQEEENKPSIFPWIIAGVSLLFCLAIATLGVFYFISK